ncbi:MAG: pseudouridine synthase [Bacteroidetes bacterium]|nr:pseudouridine synthase [Bacteroidota bacterium]
MSKKYYLIYKPFNMLSQFSKEGSGTCLKDLNFSFPSDVYPVGRLDKDSEGLLLLTNDKEITHLLLDPEFGHEREYWVQVEGSPTYPDLQPFRSGIMLGTEKCRPAAAEILSETPDFPERNPPIRVRLTIPDTWIKVILKEGKNRQVRKMTAACGFPTLRLVRTRIENLFLSGLKPGEVRELTPTELSGLKTKLKGREDLKPAPRRIRF